jgi:hypothetical protein
MVEYPRGARLAMADTVSAFALPRFLPITNHLSLVPGVPGAVGTHGVPYPGVSYKGANLDGRCPWRNAPPTGT